MAIDFETVVPKLDAILARGLSNGLGSRDGQMCIEAAVCAALDLPHGDEPACVHPVLRSYKISLNDAKWSSPDARAAGLRRLGIMQMGTDRGFDVSRFVTELSIRTVRELLSDLLERVDPVRYAAHITTCRAVTTREEARAAAGSAASSPNAASAADAAAYAAASSSNAASAAYAADAADAAYAAGLPRAYDLLMSARIAEEILMAMQTPGAVWLASVEKE
jgi:hypothetical protein